MQTLTVKGAGRIKTLWMYGWGPGTKLVLLDFEPVCMVRMQIPFSEIDHILVLDTKFLVSEKKNYVKVSVCKTNGEIHPNAYVSEWYLQSTHMAHVHVLSDVTANIQSGS